jgi:translation initiation factor 3 subunit C
VLVDVCEEEEEEEDDGFTTVSSKKGGAAAGASKAAKAQESDDDEGGSGSDDDSFWSDEDESDDEDATPGAAKSSRKDKWMQSSDDEDDRVSKKTKTKRDRSEKGKGEKKVTKKKAGADGAETTVQWTPERVAAGAADLLAKRGTRGNEPRKQATRWRALVKHAVKLEMPKTVRVSLLLQLLLTMLDSAPSLVLPMPIGLFANVAETVTETLDLLDEMAQKTPIASTIVTGTWIEGGVAGVVARLDGEWTKALRKADPSKAVYVERLRQEPLLMGLLSRTQALLARLSAKGVSAALSLRLLDHLYYRRASPSLETAGAWLTPEQHMAKVQELVSVVAADGEASSQVRALLCLVYTEALHGDFAAAKERLAVSKVADAVGGLDVPTQALFNRCLAMLGISAFRAGLFNETYSSLVDLLSSNKVRELLAQGVSIGRQASLAERALAERERERQLPFHMHLNLDMVEAVFLVSAMLVEIPASSRHHTSSRAWRRLLDLAEKQAFAGPPEATRECVLAAARHLASGDWTTAEENVLRIDALDLVPPPSEKWKEALRTELQRAALIAYVRAYSLVYRSMALDSLATRFSLPTSEVYTTLSKLIMNGDLAASWADNVLLFLAERPSKLHSVAMTVADRIAALVDVNEREFDALVTA